MSSRIMLAFLAITLTGCQNHKEKLVLYYSINEPMGQIALTIQEILESELNLEVETVIGEGSLKDIENIKRDEAHLALVENHIGFQKGVKSITPIYPQILHLFYKAEHEKTDLEDVLYGKRVFAGHSGDGSHLFALQLFNYFHIDATKFELTENPFSADVLIGFTDIISDEDLAGLQDYRLFSFDHANKFGHGSKVEGLAMKYPKVRPMLVPENIYLKLTQKPFLTVASDVVLVTNESLDNQLAYDITKAIFRNLQEFNHISPLISQDLNEDFKRSSLSFPLHNGARVYLDRDEPSFVERYAEVFGVIFSVLLALVSAIYSFGRWAHQRKKDRVDVFYQDLMKIKRITNRLSSKEHAIHLIKRIKQDQEKAFDMLVNEKLEANESFRIYMELSKETLKELQLKLKALQMRMTRGDLVNSELVSN